MSILGYTIYCLLFAVKSFCCSTSFTFIPKKDCGYQLLQAFIVFMCKYAIKLSRLQSNPQKRFSLRMISNIQYVISNNQLKVDIICM